MPESQAQGNKNSTNPAPDNHPCASFAVLRRREPPCPTRAREVRVINAVAGTLSRVNSDGEFPESAEVEFPSTGVLTVVTPPSAWR